MNPFYAQTGVDWVGVVVSPQETLSLDIKPALKVLESVLYDGETVRMFQGRVNIAFDGYDNDSRELYEVPEVRQYLAALDSKFPYWFYFLSTANDTLKLIAFCFCRTRKIKTGLAFPEPHDFQGFMIVHFDALNRLFSCFQLDESINQEISGSIADYFYKEKPKHSVEDDAQSAAPSEKVILPGTTAASFRPDYGLRLIREGFSPNVDHYFYDFRLYSLTVLGLGRYSTMVDMPYAGEMHGLSLDFDQTHLVQILAKAPEQLRAYIRTELVTDPGTPRTIDFDGEVSFGVRARLGELQKGQYESFVPLVTQEIL
jgi:hypothetical protein